MKPTKERHMDDELLTLSEVADFLRLAPRTIQRYRSAGKFCEPVILAGHTPRWWRSRVVNWANGDEVDADDAN